MDKRLSQRFEKYITNFKDQISAEIKKLNAFNDDSEKLHEFLNFVYEYERMEITHSDFLKRKRVKNTIPDRNRCNACKAGGEQCTRRRRENSLYCGTHLKGAPHGEITECPRVIDKKQLEIKFILLPYKYQIKKDCQFDIMNPQYQISLLFRKLNQQLFDFSNDFCNKNDNKKLFLNFDPVHLSSAGHKFVSKLLIK